jgi:hypothetical protein
MRRLVNAWWLWLPLGFECRSLVAASHVGTSCKDNTSNSLTMRRPARGEKVQVRVEACGHEGATKLLQLEGTSAYPATRRPLSGHPAASFRAVMWRGTLPPVRAPVFRFLNTQLLLLDCARDSVKAKATD